MLLEKVILKRYECTIHPSKVHTPVCKIPIEQATKDLGQGLGFKELERSVGLTALPLVAVCRMVRGHKQEICTDFVRRSRGLQPR